ncbi:MAG: SRPBCC family protein, partial [Deltaproteobacteria bacterium]|nr:SRPBCC family protein [Deltaproteobacteria bacterium]
MEAIMASVNTSIDIDAPVQRVWDLATDLERLGEW